MLVVGVGLCGNPSGCIVGVCGWCWMGGRGVSVEGWALLRVPIVSGICCI